MIDFKEYITALTIAMSLNELPPSPRSEDNLHIKYDELREVLNLVVSAFLLFDQNCDGYFSKDTPHDNENFLSDDRWSEMVFK